MPIIILGIISAMLIPSIILGIICSIIFCLSSVVMPGKNGEVVSLKGRVVDREAFEKMKDEYYQLRRWDVATGLQTRAQLEGVGLKDVAQDLERRGLVAVSHRG